MINTVNPAWCFEVRGFYPPNGWQLETTEVTRKEAEKRLQEYRFNCPGTAFTIRKVRNG